VLSFKQRLKPRYPEDIHIILGDGTLVAVYASKRSLKPRYPDILDTKEM
jgi:hypothetical protein